MPPLEFERTMPALAGRHTELALVTQAMDRARAETRMQVVEVVGEPGMGKTRMLEEINSRSRQDGWLVAAGRPAEFGPQPPLGMLVDALDDHLNEADLTELEAVQPGSVNLLASTFPALAARIGAGEGRPPNVDYRLMRAIRALLSVLAGPDGLVLVLDDVHHGDALTIEVLTYLLRHPPQARLLVALAYRPRQAAPRLVRPLIAATRDGLAHRMVLRPLTAHEADVLLDPRMRRWQRDLAYRRSGGNPTYLEILAAAALNTGGNVEELPGMLSAPLLGDLHALSISGRLIARAAAVVGDPFDPHLLSAVAEVDPAEALRGIDEMLSSDLIRSAGAFQQFRFRHPLVRQVAYQSASGGWRLGAHARAAAALGHRLASPAAIAHHIGRAATPGDAASTQVLIEAATNVLRTEPALAAGWLDAARQLVGHDDPSGQRVAILDLISIALLESGRLTEARAALAEMLDTASTAPGTPTAGTGRNAAPDRIAIVVRATEVDLLLGRIAVARRRLRAEIAASPDADTTRALTLALATVTLHESVPDFGVIEQVAEMIPGTAGTSVRALAYAVLAAGRVACGRPGAGEAANVAADLVDGQQDADLGQQPWALIWLARAEINLERYDLAREHAIRGAAIVRALGHMHLLPYLLTACAEVDLCQGRLAAAAVTAEQIEDTVAATGQPHPMAAMHFILQANIATARGEPAGAIAAARKAIDAIGTLEGSLARAAQLSHGYALLGDGRWQQAAQVMLDAGGGAELTALWMPVRVAVYTELVRVELARGRPHAARQWLDQAHASADPTLPGLTGRTMVAGARLVLHHDPHAAAEMASAAASLFAKAGNRIDVGRALLVAALALEGAGQDDTARDTRTEAVALLTESGAEWLANLVEDEHRAALAEVDAVAEPAPPAPVAAPARASAAGAELTALSERELQIAELVGHGHTNRQIARVLSISHKTVETYLARIFTKLDVSSRASVAKLVGRGVLIAGGRRGDV